MPLLPFNTISANTLQPIQSLQSYRDLNPGPP